MAAGGGLAKFLGVRDLDVEALHPNFLVIGHRRSVPGGSDVPGRRNISLLERSTEETNGQGPSVERAGRSARRELDPSLDRGGFGTSDVLDVGRAPPGGAVFGSPAIRRERSEGNGERPIRAVEGACLSADVLGAGGHRRHLGRAAVVVPAVRLTGAGPPGAAPRDAVDRRGDRLARPGTSDGPRHGVRHAP